MNTKSLAITIIVAFITVWVTDFLIHAVWLSSTYGATKELWRPESELMSKMPFMLLGQLLIAAAFTILFASFVAQKHCMVSTLKFSACIGVMAAASQLLMYAVVPYPGMLVAKWCLGCIVQAIVLGLVVHKVYRPPAVQL